MPPSRCLRSRALISLTDLSNGSVTSRLFRSCPSYIFIDQQSLPVSQHKCIHQRRSAHSKRHVSTTVTYSGDDQPSTQHGTTSSTTPLSCLPWTTILRSYAVTSISSIPLLLKPSLALMHLLAHTKNKILNPDHNRLLHALLKRTFYVQFCAGETPAEARKTINDLKQIGYKGVILGHAREVVLSKQELDDLDSMRDSPEQQAQDLEEVTTWRNDTLETVMLTEKGDYVALKFTGAGRQALKHLKNNMSCAPALRAAVHEICRLAQERGVSLLFDAEQAWLQDAIDSWTIYYMKHYNQSRAVVYGTYQAYAKRTPGVLAEHLAEALNNNVVLGVKLVRGAYINSDDRELFWDTIEDTHKCYDNLASCVMQRQYHGLLRPAEEPSKEFPRVELVLASHNAESVRKAQALRDQQAQSDQERIPMAYGQLMGMADHVSCALVQQANTRQCEKVPNNEVPQAYKYLVWGSTGLCMKYLLRRAQENKDAMSRTIDARRALGREIAMRLGLVST